MNRREYFVFRTTRDAIKSDRTLGKTDIKYAVVPVPKEISAECGMSITTATENVEMVIDILTRNSIWHRHITI
ncbi:MAG: DUF3343 domain-containing protein [Bacteroidales bacterium]|jgi:hypothetical protein|nr:DUF3343 domain-containing protein [Bacteroidales bacterium]